MARARKGAGGEPHPLSPLMRRLRAGAPPATSRRWVAIVRQGGRRERQLHGFIETYVHAASGPGVDG